MFRNLLITQCYADLSGAFAERMGGMANWCSFATYASKQAGQTIRKQNLQRSLQSILEKEPAIETALTLAWEIAKQLGSEKKLDEFRHSALGGMLATAAAKAGDAVSRGNKKVFDEIAPVFARFIAECMNDKQYDAARIEKFLATLHPGPAPSGQDGLRNAFGYYYKAMFADYYQTKIEWNLLANLHIGFHEQTRLQPEISEALNASLFDEERIKKFLREQLLETTSFRSKFLLFFKRIAGRLGLLDRAIEALIERVQFHLRRALTHHLMTLTIPPNRCLRLGRDLGLSYPSSLQTLKDADLLALLKQTDPHPGSVTESGAEDWSSLPDRMHFISELFRCCHLSNEMLQAPFTIEQVDALKKGLVPNGSL